MQTSRLLIDPVVKHGWIWRGGSVEVAFALSAGATLGDDPWKVVMTSVFLLSFHTPRLQNKMFRNNPRPERAIGAK